MKERISELVDYVIEHSIAMEDAVELLERAMISRTLEKTEGNQVMASKLLGIHRNTLQRKIERYALTTRRVRRKPVERVRAGSAARRKTS